MTQYLISTEIKIATCPRCGSYVFKAQDAGMAVIADPMPLDVAEYAEALLSGRRTFDLLSQAGRPWKLHIRTAASVPPGRGSHDALVAEHGCSVLGVDAVKFQEVPEDPQQAPVRRGGPSDGLHPRAAPARPSQGRTSPSPVPPVNHPLSRTYRCDACRRTIRAGEQHVAVEHAQYLWARHLECST